EGQDMVIVPLNSAFGSQSSDQQDAAISDLQRHSMAAGLRGTVVPVWESGGRFHFIAPRPWHSFFASLSMRHVAANVNKELSW
ncbi:MAG: hypothetical protein WA397_30630, partial [Roseiarcus sp.]